MMIVKNSRLLTTLVLAAALSMVHVSVLKAGDPDVPVTNALVKAVAVPHGNGGSVTAGGDVAAPRPGSTSRTRLAGAVWVARIQWSARVVLVQLLNR